MDHNKRQGLLMLSFPWKLHSLLEKNEQRKKQQKRNEDEDEQHQQQHKLPIFGWLPDGKGFAVHDQNRFVHEIMPSYFFFGDNSNRSSNIKCSNRNQSRIESFQTFQRNLELWYVRTQHVLQCYDCLRKIRVSDNDDNFI